MQTGKVLHTLPEHGGDGYTDATSPEASGGQIVGINQTVWDVAPNTLHVESDELLD